MSGAQKELYDQISGDERVIINGFAIAYRATLHGGTEYPYMAMLIGGPSVVQANELPADLAAQIETFLIDREVALYDLVEGAAATRAEGK